MKRRFFTAIFVLGCLVNGYAFAGGIPSPTALTDTCNADVLASIETRGFIEAQREVTQNANLVTKPDSVLEYTCFDQFLSVLAEEATYFSERINWPDGNVGRGMNDQKMDEALSAVVGESLGPYLTSAFGHNYLGGRAPPPPYQLTLPISGGSYTCDVMANVWVTAKCQNFAMRPEDGFQDFFFYATNDPRDMPGGSPCGPDGRMASYLPHAIAPAGAPGAAPWKAPIAADADARYSTYTEYTETGSCSSARTILTGLRVEVLGTMIEDKVCSNPGCTYNAGNCS